MTSSPQLSDKLRQKVSASVALLGQSLKSEYGPEVYKSIETLRKEMREAGKGDLEATQKALIKAKRRLEKKKNQELYQIAHGFALMLELMNCCENAYRSFRYLQKPKDYKASKNNLTYVLTAHPTEARDPQLLNLLQKIQKLIQRSFEDETFDWEADLVFYLRLLTKSPLARLKKPAVEDEAAHIYQILFHQPIFNSLIEEQNYDLKIRTWVGGDKDGHPLVNASVMKKSLQLSRRRILEWVHEKLSETNGLLQATSSLQSRSNLQQQLKALQAELSGLKVLKEGDGRRIKRTQRLSELLNKKIIDQFGAVPSSWRRYLRIWKLFPGLVIPLELREEASEIKSALDKKRSPIRDMLRTLSQISNGGSPNWYVQGFVISMASEVDDIKNAWSLVGKELKKEKIPVIPLFETQQALMNGANILKSFLSEPAKLKIWQTSFKGQFEIMLGYSDSGKESGAFFARYLIEKAVLKIDKVIKSFKLVPIFFHGSGGSVARGGGSIQEQIAWWPESMLRHLKMTIQGEMIQRIMSSKEIFENHNARVVHETQTRAAAKIKDQTTVSKTVNQALENFLIRTSQLYSELIHRADFREMLVAATPYSFLTQLKLGSRPSKRSGQVNLSKLRAIPWNLCWTQTRLLLPVWYGIGQAFAELNHEQKQELKKAMQASLMAKSFLKNLAFSLAKVELPIVELYLQRPTTNPNLLKRFSREFHQQYQLTKSALEELTGHEELLYFRPWLQESINLRSPMIHPLNLIQIIAMERKDEKILSETVVGIACGMMTTG